jgi:hypothetical protein
VVPTDVKHGILKVEPGSFEVASDWQWQLEASSFIFSEAQSPQPCRQRMRTLVQDPRGVMIRSGEPSNHLDLRVFPWLEHYVLEHDGRRVSHGRHLLNTVSRDIVHMHEGSIHLDLHRTGRS